MPLKLRVGEITISRRGYAGIVVWFKSKTYCVDPGEELKDCDVILCTHTHHRHCREENLLSFPGEKISPRLHERVKPGEELQIDEIRVLAVHAYNRPELYGGVLLHHKSCCVGYVVTFPGNTKVYYMGDTNFVDEILSIGKNITVLVPPIGGDYVMTPEEALEVVRSLKPVITIPVHYDNIEHYYNFRDIAQPYTQVIRM